MIFALVAAALVALALLGLRRRARTLVARAAAQSQPKADPRALVNLHPGHALALAGLPEADQAALSDRHVVLLRKGREVGRMSPWAWELVEREAEEWKRAAALAVRSHQLRPVPAPAPRADRCSCGGKPYAPKVVGGRLCTSTCHRAPAASENP